jgi:hypothetical protein
MRIDSLLASVYSTRKKYLIFSILFFIAALFWPFNLTIATERKFRVVDEKEKPIPAVTVQQTWYQYSLQVREEGKITTISDGVVVLPKRTVKTRWVDLLSGAFGKIIEYTINASIGSSDILIISAFGYESKSFLDGEGLGDTVVLKRQ